MISYIYIICHKPKEFWKFLLKVEYHANENSLKNSEKIAYVGQRLMYPIIKKIPYHATFSFMPIRF